MQFKLILQLAKKLIQMLAKEKLKGMAKEKTGNIVMKVAIVLIILVLGFILLICAVVMALYKYFMCSGLLGWFNDCEDDHEPIPNEDIAKLAKTMYSQRKNAKITAGGGEFRLKEESLLSDNSGSMDKENADFTKTPYYATEESINDELEGGLSNKGAQFVKMGEKYKINPAFIAAVSLYETNGMSVLLKKYNSPSKIECGIKSDLVKDCYKDSKGKEWATYASLDDGIEHMASLLKTKCVDDGKTLISECWKVYSESSAKSVAWGMSVLDYMKDMSTEDKQIFNIKDDKKEKEEAGLAEGAIDEAEIWIRILAQIDLMQMESSDLRAKNFEKDGIYYNTNLHHTYNIAKDKYGDKDDWKEDIYYYMMQVRFDVYSCYFAEDDKWFGDRCNGKSIKEFIKSSERGVVPMTEKSGDDTVFKYSKEEMLENFDTYSLADKETFKYYKDYYLKAMFEGVYGPDMGEMTIPSAGWIIPMEDGTYNLASGFRPPDRKDHNGVDMGTRGAKQVPVYASASGKVIAVGRNNGGYGGIVTIDHGNGYYSQYSHFWTEDIVVRKGDTVQQGQLLGGAGNDSPSFGGSPPAWHLHFEICKGTRTMTGTNLSPGKGPLTGCADFVDPASKEFGLPFSTSQDSSKTEKRAKEFNSKWKAKALKKEVIFMPGFTPSSGLGTLSAKYENRGDPGSCSSGVGDPGGVSCGKYQIATNPGTLKGFVDWTKKSFPQYHAVLKKSPPGSVGFVSDWKKLYKKDPNGFANAQHQFIIDSHYTPQVKAIKSRIGLDVTQRHIAVQEMVWSMAVQHNNNTPGAFQEALGKDGWKKMSDAEIITKVYDYRYDRWACCRPRFKAEKQDALDMLKGGTKKANPNLD